MKRILMALSATALLLHAACKKEETAANKAKDESWILGTDTSYNTFSKLYTDSMYTVSYLYYDTVHATFLSINFQRSSNSTKELTAAGNYTVTAKAPGAGEVYLVARAAAFAPYSLALGISGSVHVSTEGTKIRIICNNVAMRITQEDLLADGGLTSLSANLMYTTR